MQPAILISYAYIYDIGAFAATNHEYQYRELILDSGAWTAHTLGRHIDLGRYIEDCHRIKAADRRLRGMFSLDVIGDWKASLRNTEAMWKAGLAAIPVFHHGEPWDALVSMAKDYPKIGIGGIAKAHQSLKTKFAEQCFARVWPKPIHGLGYGAAPFVEKFPFHSVDASSWEIAPAAFGRWMAFDNTKLAVSCKIGVTLAAEAQHFVKLEHRVRGQWRRVMSGVDGFVPGEDPTIYLATAFDQGSFERMGLAKHRERKPRRTANV